MMNIKKPLITRIVGNRHACSLLIAIIFIFPETGYPASGTLKLRPALQFGKMGKEAIKGAQNGQILPIKFMSAGFRITIDAETVRMEKGGKKITFNRSSDRPEGTEGIALRGRADPEVILFVYGYPVNNTNGSKVNIALQGCYIDFSLQRFGLLRPLLDVFFVLFPNANQTHPQLSIPVVNAILTTEYGFKPKEGKIANAWLAKNISSENGKRILIARDEKTDLWIREYTPSLDLTNYSIQIGNEPIDKTAFTPLYLGSVLYRQTVSAVHQEPALAAESISGSGTRASRSCL